MAHFIEITSTAGQMLSVNPDHIAAISEYSDNISTIHLSDGNTVRVGTNRADLAQKIVRDAASAASVAVSATTPLSGMFGKKK